MEDDESGDLNLFGLLIFGTDNENEAFDVEAAQAIKSSNKDWSSQLFRHTGIGDLTAEAGPSREAEHDTQSQDTDNRNRAVDFSEIDELAEDDGPALTLPPPVAPSLPPPIPSSQLSSQQFLFSNTAITPAHLQEDDYDDEEDATQANTHAASQPQPLNPQLLNSQTFNSQIQTGSAPSDIMQSTQVSLSDHMAAAGPSTQDGLGGFADLLAEDAEQRAEDDAQLQKTAADAGDNTQEELDPEKLDVLRQLKESVLAHHPTEDILWFSELFPSYEAEDMSSDDEKQVKHRSQQLASRIQAAKEQRLSKLEKGMRADSQSLELAILDGRDDGYDESSIMQQALDEFELVQLQEQMHTETDRTHSAEGTIMDFKELQRRLLKSRKRPKAVCGLAKCRFHTPSKLEMPVAEVGVKKAEDMQGSMGKEPVGSKQDGKRDSKQDGKEEDPYKIPITGIKLAGTVNTYNWEQDIIWSDPEDTGEGAAADDKQSRKAGKGGEERGGTEGRPVEGRRELVSEQDKVGDDGAGAKGGVDESAAGSPMQVDTAPDKEPPISTRYAIIPVCPEPLTRPAQPMKKVYPSMLRIQPPKGSETKAPEPLPSPVTNAAPAKEDREEKDEEKEKDEEEEEEDEEGKKKDEDPDATQEDGNQPKEEKETAAVKDAPSTSQPASTKVQLPPELQKVQLTSLQHPNWMKAIPAWLKKMSKPDAAVLDFISPLVSLDLNNPHLIFEAMPTASLNKLKRAAALVLPPPPQTRMVAGPPVADNEVAKDLARFNISKDHEYSMALNKRARGLQLCRHSVPALTLMTLPLRLTHEQRLNFHRPRSVWLPQDAGQVKLKLKKLHKEKESSKEATPKLELTFKTLSGENVKLTVHDPQHTLSHYWTKARVKLGLEEVTEHPRLLDNRLRPLDPSATLTDNQLAATSSVVHVVYQEVQMLPSRQHNSLPEQGEQATRPLRPPAAFMKSKDLTATEGHVLLLEYTDERPLLLSQVGMGVRLFTHYKKRSSADNALESFVRSVNQAHQAEMSKLDPYSKGQWQYGMPNNLNPDDDITYLGHLEPGKHMLSVECQLYKAPAAAHPTAPTDFLLIRHTNGLVQLREFTGTITVGQEQPEVRVQPPEMLLNADESRFIVAVLRELRKKQRKLQGQAVLPDMKVQKLALALGLPDDSLPLLKEKCLCRSHENDDTHFVLNANATIPEEEKLREMCRPEVVCAAESSRAAITEMQKEGLMPWVIEEVGVAYLYRELTSIPPEKWQMCAEMLPLDPVYAQSAAYLEVKLQLAPWSLTDNFVSSHKEQKAGTYLALTGPGDPSGRELSFSYVREVRRSQRDTNQVAKEVEAKGITGTSADLRRMTTQQAHQALLTLGLKEEDFSNLDRWRCIGLVRELSSAAAQDGQADLAKFARTTRVPPWEQQKRYQSKYQRIFDRHLKALNGANLPADIPIRHPLIDLRNKQNQAAGTPEVGSKTASRTKGSKREDEEEREAYESLKKIMQEEGEENVDKEEREPPKPPPPKLEARAGDRRIRRVITFPDGTTREWILSKTESKERLMLFESIWGSMPSGGRRIVPAGKAYTLPALGSAKLRSVFSKQDVPSTGARSRGGGRSFSRSKRPRNSDEGFRDEDNDVFNEFEEDDEFKAAMNAGRRSKSARLSAWDDTISQGAAPSVGTARPSTSRGRGGHATPSASIATGSDHHSSGMESDGAMHDEYEMLSPESRPRRSGPKKTRRSAPRGTGAPAVQPDVEQAVLMNEYRQRLCKLLKVVLAEVIKKDKLSYDKGGVFKSKVPGHVSDYYQWVPKNEEMYLDKMSKKIGAKQYNSVQEFRDDMRQIHTNCERYNTPGNGKMAVSTLPDLAKKLVEFCEENLERMKDDFAAVEAILTGGAPAADKWIQCERCNKWRRVSESVYAMVDSAEPWYCALDFDRPGANCDLPPDDAGLEHVHL